MKISLIFRSFLINRIIHSFSVPHQFFPEMDPDPHNPLEDHSDL